MQNNANEMAVFNTAIYVRLSKEDIVAAQSGRESNSITNQKKYLEENFPEQYPAGYFEREDQTGKNAQEITA